MENASKALIMAGSVLIGVILLTTMVFVFRSTGGFASSYDDRIEESVVAKFNEQFTKYDATKYNDTTKQLEPVQWSIHDLITLINLAENYNEKAGEVVVDVIIDGRSYITSRVLDEQDKIDELQNNTNTYTCLGVEYDEFTRKVNSIKFRHI